MTNPSTNLNRNSPITQPVQPERIEKASSDLAPIFSSAIEDFKNDLQKLNQHNPAASAWLKCCAYLDPASISEKVVTQWLSTHSNSNNTQNPKDVLLILKEYNLISWDMATGNLSLDSQMQELLRCENKDSAESDLIEVMKVLHSSFNGRYPTTEGVKHNASLLPHFKMVLSHVQNIQEPSLPAKQALIQTLIDTGVLYTNLGSYQQAATLLEQASKLARVAWGEMPVQVIGFKAANLLNDLGILHYKQGQYDEAAQLHKRALEHLKKILGEVHPDVAGFLNNLGVVYYKQGQYDNAIKCYKEALEIQEKTLPEDHPDIANSLNNLAVVYCAQGEYDEAIKLLERALQIKENALEENHPDIADFLTNLGNAHSAKRQDSVAIQFHEQALKIKKNTLGENHPDVADSLNNLGLDYFRQGWYNEAAKLYEQALKILEQVLGNNDPKTIMVCKNLEDCKNARNYML